ncbi:hypothetical protein [Formosa algae]|uniref:Uncharacterized protein n=1 Tax=Formosa algae TaxID=225843 RepID=A0A9X0YL80_9FLAO|nr:hypothetical protein [Formosa algae]MBP1838971.1 hypothetical protein [Formosa algae]MDQ0333748.1 hypothetical protein [Formosa algae]OEI78932.1 hypothetical protein AST99_17310 [Formosa algae]PNW29262.1 hypothetical protein BKP44_04815 [Formosa algae]
MKNFYLTLLVFLISLSSFSQIENLNATKDYQAFATNSPINGSWARAFNSETNTIKGDIYLYDGWSNNSQIYFDDVNSPLKTSRINYNLQAERFELKESKDSVFIINPGNVRKVVVGTSVFKRYLDPEFRRNSFFQELFLTSEKTLLKKYQLDIIVGAVNPMTNQKMKADAYNVKEKYFVLAEDSNEVLKEVKLNKKLVYSFTSSDKADEVKQYVKNHHLSYKDDNDVILILNYIKTL